MCPPLKLVKLVTNAQHQLAADQKEKSLRETTTKEWKTLYRTLPATEIVQGLGSKCILQRLIMKNLNSLSQQVLTIKLDLNFKVSSDV